ncbi:SGNH/GDSL hydrolase family protein [Beggiatoa alba]|nr:SGNH/GDSL hydrolase family protein [Beggiatoa alba]
MTYKQNWFEVNPRKTITFLVIFGFLVIDFSLAAVLKIVGLFEPSYVTSSIREAHYRRTHSVYHHDLAKNIHHYLAEWGKQDYLIDTNSLGFKDRSNLNIPLVSASKRILLIGDSFTEGVGIKFEFTFAGLLQQHFKTSNIEILNAAVSSYSPIIYYRKIKYLIERSGLKFDAVVVFIDLSDIEDEALGYKFDNNGDVITKGNASNLGAAPGKPGNNKILNDTKSDSRSSPLSMKEFFTQYTYFLGRLRNLAALLKSKTHSWQEALNKRRAMWTMDETLYNEFGKQGLEIAAKHMSLLKAYLDAKNIPLTVAIYPWPDQIYNNDIHSKQVIFWGSWGKQHKVDIINLFNVFIPAREPENTIKQYYIKGDIHWNKAGHEAVFQALKNRLKP